MITRCGEIQRGAHPVSKHVRDSAGKTIFFPQARCIAGRNSSQHLLNAGIEGAGVEFSDIGQEFSP
jgi:hypothetical protein